VDRRDHAPTDARRYKMMKQLLRIILPIVFVVIAAIYLNSAIFSAWVSGGPPNDYPEAWAYRSMRHFYYGLGFIVIAVTIFLSLKANAKRIMTKCIIGSIVALALFFVPHLKKFIEIDSCLDHGGKWNYSYHRCDK
jgi:hypothetical protein